MPTEFPERAGTLPEADNTRRSFSDKWNLNPDLAFEATLRESSEIHRWILERNGFQDVTGLAAFLRTRERILDAGCGNGRVTALLRKYAPERTEIVAIDLVSAPVAAANLAGYGNVRVLERDLTADLSDLGEFDFIYAQEVLHHTPDPLGAFLNLAKTLRPAGVIAIYVYRRKAPIRELTDDYVRGRIAGLSYEDALRVCESITELGRVLSAASVKIQVPDVPVLGIEAGTYDLQRFLYHHFTKCFWNEDLSFHDNAVINYDWYHPQLCSRHTIDEVREWLYAANLSITHEHSDPYGITVHGARS